jgi:MFS family permease
VDKRLVIFLAVVALSLSYALLAPVPPLPQSTWIIALGSGLEGVGLSTLIGTLYAVVVFPHFLSHSSQVLKVPQDDLLSDKISSSLQTGYGAASIALGTGCGPVLGSLIVKAVGMEHSFWVVSGIFAVAAVLYSLMTGLWRSLLCLKQADHRSIEMGSLSHNPPSS